MWYNEKKEFKKEIKISSLEGRFKVNEKLDLIDNKKKIEKFLKNTINLNIPLVVNFKSGYNWFNVHPTSK